MDNMAFWKGMDQIVANYELVIDRPRGTSHPRYPDRFYPFDYGYLKDTCAMDQGGIDVWVGTLAERSVTAIICTVDLLKKDAELKILLGCSSQEAAAILKTHNDGPMSAILIMRPGDPQ